MIRSAQIFCVLLLVPMISFSQTVEEAIEKAYAFQTTGKHEQAASVIDNAVGTKKGSQNEIAWHIRGFVYKDLFLKNRTNAEGHEQREISVESLKRSIELDDENKLTVQNEKALKYLAISYFNDASDIISLHQPGTIETADELYTKYKSIILQIYPDTVLDAKDVEYYLAMSTAHRKIYESDREKFDNHYHKSNDYLTKVLDIDPNSFNANFSKGVTYYNRGVHKLARLPYVEIYDFMEIQSESMRCIEAALPFMQRAYEIDSTKLEVVKALKIITFNLNKEEESKHYQQLEESLRDGKDK